MAERFIKYNQSGFGYRTLSIIYANLGREQEARAMLDKATEGWPPTMKNVRFMMTIYPLKDLQVMERFAESYIKAESAERRRNQETVLWAEGVWSQYGI